MTDEQLLDQLENYCSYAEVVGNAKPQAYYRALRDRFIELLEIEKTRKKQ